MQLTGFYSAGKNLHLLALRKLGTTSAGIVSESCRVFRPRTGEHEYNVKLLKSRYTYVPTGPPFLYI